MIITLGITEEETEALVHCIHYELTHDDGTGGKYWEHLQSVLDQIEEQLKYARVEGRGR